MKHIKRVSAYQALGGTLHEDRASAAFHSIIHLGQTTNKDQRGQCIGECEVAWLIENRKQIAAILTSVDAPESE